jgi:hypothetical protein
LSAAAGYSGKPLWQKLGLKPGQRYLVDNPPSDYAALTGFDLSQLVYARNGEADFVHVFVADRAALDAVLDRILGRIADGGMAWVSWPKKTSRLFRDLTEDGIRAAALPRGWVDIKVCAVDDDWSGLKLARRRG